MQEVRGDRTPSFLVLGKPASVFLAKRKEQ